MDRRKFMLNTAMTGTLLASAACPARASERKPNIVFIMADDLGYRELGCYGQKKIKTPNIDRIRAEGMKFTRHYAGSAVCAPSRCSLMTGKHGGHAYVRDNYEIGPWESHEGQLPLPAGEMTLAEMLRGRGYRTGAFGKWGLGAVNSSGDPLKQGFDRFFGYNCQRHAHNLYPRYLIDDREEFELEGNTRGLSGRHYAPKVIADKMLDWVRENKDEPFFLYYPTVIPHLPLQVPKEYIDMYRGQWQEKPYEAGSYLSQEYPRSAYAGMITFMDHQVGRLLGLLEELGVADDTFIVFTSDNGTTYLGPDQVDYEFFESVGNLRGMKGSLYEGGIRVPMVAKWPGRIKAGTASDFLCGFEDWMPTMLEIAGGPALPGDECDGVSLVPVMTGAGRRKREFLFREFRGYGGQQAVWMDDWKGIRRNMLKGNLDIELYNLADDPGEKNNVAGEHEDIVAEIAGIMQREHNASEIFPIYPIDDPMLSISSEIYIMGQHSGSEGKRIYSDGAAEEYRVRQANVLVKEDKAGSQEQRDVKRMKLSQQEMRELKELLKKSDFFDMDSNQIARDANLHKYIADANTIKISASLDGKTNTVSVYALDTDVHRLVPQNKEIQQLKEIHDKIKAAGGKSGKK